VSPRGGPERGGPGPGPMEVLGGAGGNKAPRGFLKPPPGVLGWQPATPTTDLSYPLLMGVEGETGRKGMGWATQKTSRTTVGEGGGGGPHAM